MASSECIIELHVHADGSLPIHTAMKLIREQPSLFSPKQLKEFEDPALVRKLLTVPEDCDSLEEYLRCFELPLKLLQTPKSMWIAGCELVEELDRQGVTYAEIRFAPQLHSGNIEPGKKFAHEEEILKSFLEGIEYALKRTHVRVNVILCMMRNLPEGNDGSAANIRTLFLATKYLGKGVVAVDLAGAEARDATSEFKLFFDIAAEQGIPFTIHAGEAGSDAWRVDSIERAIAFGARRIGHGVALDNSRELRRLVREKSIVVECCLTSNLQTKAVDGGIENHPIKRLIDEGILVTLNTDNMTVSNTTLQKEYELAKSGLGFTDEDIRFMQLNALEGAFISNGERRRIKKKYGFK